MKNLLFIFLLFSFEFKLSAEDSSAMYTVQDTTIADTSAAEELSLLDELDAIATAEKPEPNPRKTPVHHTFGGVHLINGQTTETIDKKVMQFIVAHRFGRVNGGWREFLGLDQASVRISFDYGILDNLMIGVGRSTFNKTFDGYVKYRFLTQKEKGMPLSMAFYANMAIGTQRFIYQNRKNYFSSRLSYTFQLLIARKFNDYFSLQLMPTLVHKNLVQTVQDKNSLFILGAGFKVKVYKRLSISAEYYARIKDNKANGYQDAFAIGLDVVTGGHVFQFQVTNAQAMYDAGFLRETTGKFWKGDIHFGFNISRTWGVGKQAKAERKAKKARRKAYQESGGKPYH
jgi:hypothetical protein